RTGEFPGRTIAQARRFRDDLVIGRIHVIGELDLDAGTQTRRRHADAGADDTGFADRRIEAAAFAVFLLKPCRATEDAPEIADILAEHDDGWIPLHHDIKRVLHRFD